MTGAVQRPAQSLGLDLVLPGDWWRIPLGRQAERRAAVRALLKRQVSGLVVTPALLRDLTTALDAVADDAHGSGGLVLWMSTGLVAQVPLSVTLVAKTTDASDLDALAESLPPAHDVVTGRLEAGRVVRRVHVRDGTGVLDGLLAATPGGSGVLATEELRRADRVLLGDYWVERPWGGLVHLAFSSPIVPLREPLVELFDTVVETVVWRDDEPAGNPVHESGGADGAAATT